MSSLSIDIVGITVRSRFLIVKSLNTPATLVVVETPWVGSRIPYRFMTEVAEPVASCLRRDSIARFDRVPAAVLLMGAMIAFQVGGALGVWLLPAFGAIGTAAVRTAIPGCSCV